MFEKPGPQCPVASLELDIKHLNPKNEFLFQRPKKRSKIGVAVFVLTIWWSVSARSARK